jgi:hypothetical protein
MAKMVKNTVHRKARRVVSGQNPDFVCLSDFVENPDNPQKIGQDAFLRLVEKVRQNPKALRANSIAYVRDDERAEGRRLVLSGNKRLRVLRAIYGEDGQVPAAWFVDVTDMTPEERKRFIVEMNVNDGEWDVEMLLEQYSPEELNAAGLQSIVDSVAGVESIIEMGDEMGDGDDLDEKEHSGLVTLKIPPELVGAWRYYKRKVGTEKLVDFITQELKAVKRESEKAAKTENQTENESED